MADSCEGGILAGVILTSYTLSIDLSCVFTSPVSVKSSSTCYTRIERASDDTISVSWTDEYGYPAVSQQRMMMLRFNLPLHVGLGSVNSRLSNRTPTDPKIPILQENIRMLERDCSRSLYIQCIKGELAGVVVGGRRPPRFALPFVVCLNKQSGELS